MKHKKSISPLFRIKLLNYLQKLFRLFSTLCIGQLTLSCGMISEADHLIHQLVISPNPITLTVGESQQFQVLGINSKGQTKDLSRNSIWRSNRESIFIPVESINGKFNAVNIGQVKLTAIHQGKYAESEVSIVAPKLKSIITSPQDILIAVGEKLPYMILGYFTDHIIRDIADLSQWSVSDSSMLQVEQHQGMQLIGRKTGTVQLTINIQDIQTQQTIHIIPEKIIDIQIEPEVLSFPLGQAQTIQVMGLYSNGERKLLQENIRWEGTNGHVSVTQNGIVTGLDVGIGGVYAHYGEFVTYQPVEITPEVLESLDIVQQSINPQDFDISLGETISFKATGLFSNLKTKDITELVSWSCSPSCILEFNNISHMMNITFEQLGSIEITIQLQEFNSTQQLIVGDKKIIAINILPDRLQLPLGHIHALQAVGLYSDGSTENLQNDIIWEGTNGILTVTENGLVTGLRVGTGGIYAKHKNKYSYQSFQILPPILEDIRIVPLNDQDLKIPEGNTITLVAQGIWSDGTIQPLRESLIWTPSNPNQLALIGEYEEISEWSGHSKGNTIVIIEALGLSSSIEIEVTPAQPTHMTITPEHLTIALGEYSQFEAILHFSNGETQTITEHATWRSDNSVAIVQNTIQPGRAKSLRQGETTIRAQYEHLHARSIWKVEDPKLIGLSLLSDQQQIPLGTSTHLNVLGHLSNELTFSLDSMAEITSSNTSIAEIIWQDSNQPIVLSKAIGNTTISTTFGQYSDTFTLQVIEPIISRISIIASGNSIPLGKSINLQSIIHSTDNSEEIFTNQSVWSVNGAVHYWLHKKDIQTIEFRPELTGTYVIHAQVFQHETSITIEVTPSIVESISAEPSNVIVSSITPEIEQPVQFFSHWTNGDITSLTEDFSCHVSNGTVAQTRTCYGHSCCIQAVRDGNTILDVEYSQHQISIPIHAGSYYPNSLLYQVRPTKNTLEINNSLQMYADITLSNGVTIRTNKWHTLEWFSTDPNICTVSNDDENSGKVTRLSPGTAVVFARDKESPTTIYGQSFIVDSNYPLSREINGMYISAPASISSVGSAISLDIFNIYMDGSNDYELTQEINWTVSPSNIISTPYKNPSDPTGRFNFMCISPGSVIVTASAQLQNKNISKSSIVYCIDPSQDQISYLIQNYSNLILPKNRTIRFRVLGGTMSSTYKEATSEVHWHSYGQSIYKSNDNPFDSLFTTQDEGFFAITIHSPIFPGAVFNNIAGTITASPFMGILLTPEVIIEKPSQATWVKAFLIYEDNTQSEITPHCQWFSSNEQIVTVNNDLIQSGLIRAIAPGQATIYCDALDSSGSFDFTITP